MYQRIIIKFSKILANVSAGLTFIAPKSLVDMVASPICCKILKLVNYSVWLKIYCFPNYTEANCLFIISRFFKINFLICLLILGHSVFCIHKKYLFYVIQNFHLYFSFRIYFTVSFPLLVQLSWISSINRKKEKCIL